MPITIKNSAGGGVTLDSTTSSNETLNLPSGGGTLAPLASPRFTGNVGINEASPQGTLHVKTSDSGATAVAGADDLIIEVADYGGMSILSENEGHIYFGDNEDADIGRIEYQHSTNNMIFRAGGTDRMTIEGTGSLLIGRPNANFSDVQGLALNQGNSGESYVINNGVVFYINRGNTEGKTIRFYKSYGTEVGNISTFGASTAYNTSSDYRIKTDVQPITAAADRVKLLKPCNFEWIADGSRADGFLAHELAEVVPIAVTGAKDAMEDEEYEVTPAVVDDEDNETTAAVMGTRSVPDLQGIDQSKLVPLLTATIQELITRIEALEA